MKLFYLNEINPVTSEDALSSCAADFILLVYSSQWWKNFAAGWLLSVTLIFFSFFSESGLNCRGVSSLASWYKKLTRRYKGIGFLPDEGWHLSASLCVRTAELNTLQVDGGQVVLYIQAVEIYWMKSCKGAVDACTHSRTNIGWISSSGKNGKAITLRRKRLVSLSFWYLICSLSSWICKENYLKLLNPQRKNLHALQPVSNINRKLSNLSVIF